MAKHAQCMFKSTILGDGHIVQNFPVVNTCVVERTNYHIKENLLSWPIATMELQQILAHPVLLAGSEDHNKHHNLACEQQAIPQSPTWHMERTVGCMTNARCSSVELVVLGPGVSHFVPHVL